ncbi:MAG: hypothetical protein VR66_05055 [Peptococcaceae bacterium BRH_c23]|nr:MAG: hypothetical protein VR66_05055 [Peptococcaceae bacterium BRH_c23]KJS86370.1 MAG: hypothetical protein JL57_16655 [Desulfosporosinus sp. BICA1-9]HBW35622.1 hypothetical protein [Desulfosporosinus sp.]
MRFAVKVKEEDIDKWTEGFNESTGQVVNLNWWTELPMGSIEWKWNSLPKFYKKPDQKTYLVVYEAEGIIFKRVTTN